MLLALSWAQTEHISLHLASLYWLPIDSTIQYKLTSLCYKYNCLNMTASVHLTNSWKCTNQPASYALLPILPFFVFPPCLVRDLFLMLSYAAPSVSNNLPCKVSSSSTLASFIQIFIEIPPHQTMLCVCVRSWVCFDCLGYLPLVLCYVMGPCAAPVWRKKNGTTNSALLLPDRGAGILQWLERLTRRKVVGLSPGGTGRRENFPRHGQLFVLLFRYSFNPRVTAAARKISRSLCRKCWRQVTRMRASGFAWSDMMHSFPILLCDVDPAIKPPNSTVSTPLTLVDIYTHTHTHAL